MDSFIHMSPELKTLQKFLWASGPSSLSLAWHARPFVIWPLPTAVVLSHILPTLVWAAPDRLPLCLLPASLWASQSLGLYPHFGWDVPSSSLCGWMVFIPQTQPRPLLRRMGWWRVWVPQPRLVGLWGIPENMSHLPERSTDLSSPSPLSLASSSPQRLSSQHQSYPGEVLLFKPGPSHLASTTVADSTWLRTNPSNSEEHLPSSWSWTHRPTTLAKSWVGKNTAHPFIWIGDAEQLHNHLRVPPRLPASQERPLYLDACQTVWACPPHALRSQKPGLGAPTVNRLLTAPNTHAGTQLKTPQT